MLIKWRQEMESVGLLLSCFSRDQRSSTYPPPIPHPSLSVLLTYIDHNPPHPDIHAASGNHQPSSPCGDVTRSTTKWGERSSLQVCELCGSIQHNGVDLLPMNTVTAVLQEDIHRFFFFFFTPRPPAPSARRGEAGIKGLALSIRVRAEAAFPFWENSPSRENPGDGQRPPRHVPVWLRCYESPVTSPHSLPLQWSFSSDLNRQPGFNIHLVPMLIKGKVHKNIKNTLVL